MFKSQCGKEYTEEQYRQLDSEQQTESVKICDDINCECEVRVIKEPPIHSTLTLSEKLDALESDAKAYKNNAKADSELQTCWGEFINNIIEAQDIFNIVYDLQEEADNQ